MYKRQEFSQGLPSPHKIRIGEIVTDLQKRKWRIGKSIGGGGFADIYEVSEDIHKAVGPDAKYVMKIEPSRNGPLFVELHCYHRIGKESDIKQWMKDKNLPHLGMPRLVASGCHYYRGNKYRFIILDKFGKDVQALFEECKRKIPAQTALNLAIKTLDILEYIHSYGYIHGDIKGSNLLLDKKLADKKVYLLDFGLAVKYLQNGNHAVYGEDLRFAHGGTIEYASRDAHIGAYSRKSDLESLGYNLVHWCSGSLPWENCLDDEEAIKERKMKYMNNIDEFMTTCFSGRNKGPARVLAQYLTCVDKMRFEADPNYSRLKNVLVAGLQLTSPKLSGKPGSKSKRPAKRKSNEENANAPPPKLKLGEARKPLSSCRNLRSTPDYVENFQFDLDELFKIERSLYKERVEAESKTVIVEDPTPIMKQVLAQLKKAANGGLRKNCPITPEGEPLENFDHIPNAVMEEVERKLKKHKVTKAEKSLLVTQTEVTKNKKGSKSSAAKANEVVVLDKNSNETLHKRRSKLVMCKLDCCRPSVNEDTIAEVSFKTRSNVEAVSENSVPHKHRKSGKAAQKRLFQGKFRRVMTEEDREDTLSRKKENVRLRMGQELASDELRPSTRRTRHLSAYHTPPHSNSSSRAPSPNEILVESSADSRKRRHQSTQPTSSFSRPSSPQALVDRTGPDCIIESRPVTRRKRHASSIQPNMYSRPSSPETIVNPISLESSMESRSFALRKRRASSIQPNAYSRSSSPEILVNQISEESNMEYRLSTRRKRRASSVQPDAGSRPSSPSLESRSQTRRRRHLSAHPSVSRPQSPISLNSEFRSTRRKRQPVHSTSNQPGIDYRPSSPYTCHSPVNSESTMVSKTSTRRKRHASVHLPSRPPSPCNTTPTKFNGGASETPDLDASPYRKQRDSKSLACHLMSTPPSSYGLIYL